jgi:serine/threonine-protein kinase HipA
VNGNGRNPGMNDLLAVAEQIKLDKKKAISIADNIREIVSNELYQMI